MMLDLLVGLEFAGLRYRTAILEAVDAGNREMLCSLRERAEKESENPFEGGGRPWPFGARPTADEYALAEIGAHIQDVCTERAYASAARELCSAALSSLEGDRQGMRRFIERADVELGPWSTAPDERRHWLARVALGLADPVCAGC